MWRRRREEGAPFHGSTGSRQSTRAMPRLVFRRSALSLLALTLLLPAGEGAAEAGVSGTTASHVSAKTGDKVIVVARAKRGKRRPATGGKPKPEAAAAAADSSDAEADESSLLGGAAKPAPESAEDKPVRKRPKMEAAGSSESAGGGDGDGDADAKVSKKSAPKATEEEESESSGPSGALSALEIGFGARALFRSLSWTSDANAAGLGPYSLSPGPATGAWLEFYPAAFGSKGFGANVGIYGSLNLGFGVVTDLANGGEAATGFRDFTGGLKVRIPVGTFIPNVSIGYGQQTFQIAAQGMPTDLPHVNYQFVRAGAGARIQVSPSAAIDFGAAYLLVLDPGSGAGQIKSAAYFPSAKSYGVDLGGSLGLRLTNVIGVRAGVDLRFYAMGFSPATDARAVRGAVDRYLVTWAGLEVVLDGQGGGAASSGGGSDDDGDDEEEPKPSKRKKKAPKSEEAEDEEEES